MYKISEDIYNSTKNKLMIKEVPYNICEYILETITKFYVDTGKKGIWLWEKLNEYISISDSYGWSYIKDYVLDNDCIMFFNQDEEKKMFKISNGKDLQFILSETNAYEFYITDLNCTYLLCFNHHDVLIGCGEAIKWMNNLKEKTPD